MTNLIRLQPQLFLGFQDNGTHEMGVSLTALQASFSLVPNVLPEAPPLIVSVPDVRALIERHAVLPTILKNLLNTKRSGIHTSP